VQVAVSVGSKVNLSQPGLLLPFSAAAAALLQWAVGLNGTLLLYQSRLLSMTAMTSSQSGHTSSAHVSHSGCTM